MYGTVSLWLSKVWIQNSLTIALDEVQPFISMMIMNRAIFSWLFHKPMITQCGTGERSMNPEVQFIAPD